MRQLRFLTLTEDGHQLIVESSEGDEQFALRLDAAVRLAIGGEPPRRPVPAPTSEPLSSLAPEPVAPVAPVAEPPMSPREIQVRIRAGESPEDLAAAYGTSLQRVMRFASAAVEERSRIASEARRARARRTGSDGAESRVVVFGETVDERFRAHGIDADTVSWDARRRDDGEWLVAAKWIGGESTHTAEWLFSRVSRSVAPIDDAATDLLSDRPIRPMLPPEPPRPTLVAAPPLVPGIVAFPPMPDAATGPVPRIEEVFDQEALPEGPRDLPAPVPAASAEPDFDAPPLPLGIAEPGPRPGQVRKLGAGRRDESEEERAARARIPSWDDILLGVRRKD
jgi:hypothetical protein